MYYSGDLENSEKFKNSIKVTEVKLWFRFWRTFIQAWKQLLILGEGGGG